MDASATDLSAHIPESILPYPEGMWNRAKYHFWKGIYPFHNRVRDILLKTHILTPPYTYRQNYVIGRLRKGRKMADFLRYLDAIEFRNHFIAWDDDGQVASLRKLVDFEWQYHLRIFKDGEVRGHYELTPESHPFQHYNKRGQEPRREDFLAFLGDWIVPIGPVASAAVRRPATKIASRAARGRKRKIEQ
jgi:hypothetical protein